MSDESSPTKTDFNLGRKVFFLDPPYNFVKQNISKLRMLEYEIYIVGDYKNIKNILLQNPHSILYIYVDSILSKRAWINFISSIQHTEEIKDVRIGIFTKGLTESQQNDLFTNTHIDCGIILLQGLEDTISAAFAEQLDRNGAKGRRKYVRADCDDIKAAQLFITSDGKMYSLPLLNISSVGCAVEVPKNTPLYIEKNTMLRGASLQLHRAIRVDLLCFAIKEEEESNTAVFLFVQASTGTKNIVREYVSILLQKRVNDSIAKLQPDEMNYNLPLSKILGKKEEKKEEKEEQTSTEEATEEKTTTEDKPASEQTTPASEQTTTEETSNTADSLQ